MTERYSEHQAQIFGEDPSLYDRFRPGYPRALMETVIANTSDHPVLEIGAGTGKATKALVALGKRVHVIEPDARMAALLEVSCGSGLAAVQHTTLERAGLQPTSFELALAAQSWHWVDPMIGYDLVADALVPDGRLGLIWHHPQPDQGLLGEAMAQLYRSLVPEMTQAWPGTKGRDFDPATEPAAALIRFGGWHRLEHRWHRRMDAPTLIGWLCTNSDHRLLSVELRTELMTAVASLVAQFGGSVTVKMTTVAHLAHRL